MNIQLRKKDSTVYIMFYRNSSRVMISTGEKITEKQWNKKANKIKLSTPDTYKIQQSIDRLIEKIKSIVLDNPKINNADLKKQATSVKVASGVFEVADLFLHHVSVTGSTQKHARYKSIIDKLRLISPRLTWDAINMNLYDDILKWYHENDYSVNTIGRHITYYKTFFNYAAERGYVSQYAFKNFKSFSQELPIIYLTEEELSAIAAVKLDARLDKIRDLFVFMCYTGLRHSDAVSILPAHFQNDVLIKTTIKTSDPNLTIPLVGQALRIAKKYEYKLPRISSQKMNDNLTDIGRKAKIESMVPVIEFKASGRVETVEPKYKLITSKMARKTFVTLSLQKGIPADVIMSITGHKKHDVMRKYLKISSELKRNELNKWT